MRRIARIGFAALALCAAAFPALAGEVIYTETTQAIDSSAPVTDGNTTAWRWAYRLQLPALLAGDVIHVSSTAEIRNDAGVNIEVVDQITLTPGWPYYAEDLWGLMGAAGPAYFVKASSGEDVNPERHYRLLTASAQMQVPADMPQAYVHVRFRCRSTSVQGYCSNMGAGYGKLSVTIFRP